MTETILSEEQRRYILFNEVIKTIRKRKKAEEKANGLSFSCSLHLYRDRFYNSGSISVKICGDLLESERRMLKAVCGHEVGRFRFRIPKGWKSTSKEVMNNLPFNLQEEIKLLRVEQKLDKAA